MRIEVSAPFSLPGMILEERLGPFSGEPPAAAGVVRIDWRESSGTLSPEGELVYDPGAIWRMFRTMWTWCAEISYADRTRDLPREEIRSLLHANETWDDLVLFERRRGDGWHSMLSLGAGELAVRTAILGTGGLLFHASAVDDNGQGIVFSGRSGAGKSTQLDLWRGREGVITMTDDRVAVRCRAGEGATCYGTPWGGYPGLSRNHAAPLVAIVMLEQASENSIERLSPQAAAARLACRAFLPYWDRGLMRRAFRNLEELVRSVPVYRLRCRAEPAAVDLVRSVL
ncbi:hypothetical protein CHL67_02420 [Prosthecochloris sp. GSB1]|uniref:hypothetical protein n=1 Tax=Prosthecochloris sp. GSB1 TaxID=281093 RepID=UPI000B8CC384|nr:hypothetical protein [Prosthecochloris sp. GSB1]ASQ89927.1 hypothetical protein CHL67_02420 [Prosthecochloris sp. GSB1]